MKRLGRGERWDTFGDGGVGVEEGVGEGEGEGSHDLVIEENTIECSIETFVDVD